MGGNSKSGHDTHFQQVAAVLPSENKYKTRNRLETKGIKF